MRTLETPRLVLVPQTAAHAAEMFRVLGDPAIYAYENAPPPSEAWLRARFEKLESRVSPDGSEHWLNWVVKLRANGLIGYVQATVVAGGRANIAYEFASAHWGRGLAHEAVGALVEELRQAHGVTELAAVAKSANQRSLRLLERLGFTPATPAALEKNPVEPDEVLACRFLA